MDESSNENMLGDNTSDDGQAGNRGNDESFDAGDPFASESDKVPKHGISMFTCSRIRAENKRSLQNVFGL